MIDDEPESLAFRATYADLKIIKTRGVVQVHFEADLKEFNHIIGVLGGAPRPDSEVWCAIARLNASLPRQPARGPVIDQEPAPVLPKPRLTHWDMKPSQRAGNRCGDVRFQTWLHSIGRIPVATEEAATEYVRKVAGGQRRNLGQNGFDRETETWDKIDHMFERYIKTP